jgi:hypothetical protein
MDLGKVAVQFLEENLVSGKVYRERIAVLGKVAMKTGRGTLKH